MPTRAEVTAYSRAQNAVVAAARRDLDTIWLLLGDQAWEADQVRRMARNVFPSLVTKYGDAAATLAAEWFEQQIGERAVLAATIPEAQATAAATSVMDPLFTGNPSQVLANMGLVLDRMVKQPGRDTIQRSARERKVGWARVPTGSKTCAFCMLLASNGVFYSSRESAGWTGRRGDYGDAFHDECNCVVTPVRSDDDLPAGYDPDVLEQAYVDARKVAGGSTKAILAEMRKQQGIA